MQARVSRILHGTPAEGPGLRTAIWFQGCSIRCRACINPHLFRTEGGYTADVDELVGDARDARVEGLTLLGGEPFDQAPAAAAIARRFQMSGLGVITMTGFTVEQLATRPDSRELLDVTDLLIDGPYDAGRPEGKRALVGSENQRFIHLSQRYRQYQPVTVRNQIHISVGKDGEAHVAGFLSGGRLIDLTEGSNTSRSLRF